MGTYRKQALDVLLECSGARSVSAGSLLVLGVGLLLIALSGMSASSDSPVMQVVNNLLLVIGGLLPFCYAWDSQLLDRARRSRFLELVLLTSMSVEEWSDGLLWHSFRGLWIALIPLYLVGMGTAAVFDPGLLPHTALWLPTVVSLMILVSQFHQLRAVLDVNRPGQEVLQFLVSAPIAATGLCLVVSWMWFGMASTLVLEMSALVVIILARELMQLGLKQVLLGRDPVNAAVGRVRAWSQNPIVQRESARAARRGWGGAVMLYVRRYSLLAAFLGLFVHAMFEQRALLSWTDPLQDILQYLQWYAFLVVPLVYLSTLSAVFDERRQRTADLLESCGMRAREYIHGWIQWATRYRNLELLALFGVAPLSALLGQHAFTIDLVWYLAAMALLVYLTIRTAVYVALLASARSRTWVGMQLYMLRWLLPALLFLGLEGNCIGTTGELLTRVSLAVYLLLGSRHCAFKALSDPSGLLTLTGESSAS